LYEISLWQALCRKSTRMS